MRCGGPPGLQQLVSERTPGVPSALILALPRLRPEGRRRVRYIPHDARCVMEGYDMARIWWRSISDGISFPHSPVDVPIFYALGWERGKRARERERGEVYILCLFSFFFLSGAGMA